MIKYCEHCGTEFTSVRISAKYCKDSCKTKANNQRRVDEKTAEIKKQKQAKIDDMRKDKADALLIIEEQKAEETRLSELASAMQKDELRIAAEALELKKKQDAADQAKRTSDNEDKKEAWNTARRIKELKKKIQKSNNVSSLKVLGILALISVGFKIAGSSNSQKNNSTKPEDSGKFDAYPKSDS